MPAAPCTRCGGPRGYVALCGLSDECEDCGGAAPTVTEPATIDIMQLLMRSIERATGGV
jgi:hypothetical protein